MTDPLFEPKWQYYGNCTGTCPGGSPCYCQVEPGSKHSMCICDRAACSCHARERYEPMPQPDWKEIAVVRGIRFRQYLGKTGLQPLKPKNLTYDEWRDLQRARGLEKIPDAVAPGWFDVDLETFDNMLDLMEQYPDPDNDLMEEISNG